MLRIASNDLVLTAKLIDIYDIDYIHSKQILVEEMLAPLYMRAGIDPDDIPAFENMAIPVPNVSRKLLTVLEDYIPSDTLNFLCATIDLPTDTAPRVCLLKNLNLMQHYHGDKLVIYVDNKKINFLSCVNGESIIEVVEGVNFQAILEGVCEFIDFYKLAERRQPNKE